MGIFKRGLTNLMTDKLMLNCKILSAENDSYFSPRKKHEVLLTGNFRVRVCVVKTNTRTL